ncbi:hypothetical protein ACFUJ0_34580, partial [Streptomyces sp. NPDC057242]
MAVEVCEFGGDAAFGGAGGRGGEGLGGEVDARVAFIRVGFAGVLGFAGASSAALALSGGVVAAVVDFTAGPQAGAVPAGATGWPRSTGMVARRAPTKRERVRVPGPERRRDRRDCLETTPCVWRRGSGAGGVVSAWDRSVEAGLGRI